MFDYCLTLFVTFGLIPPSFSVPPPKTKNGGTGRLNKSTPVMTIERTSTVKKLVFS